MTYYKYVPYYAALPFAYIFDLLNYFAHLEAYRGAVQYKPYDFSRDHVTNLLAWRV